MSALVLRVSSSRAFLLVLGVTISCACGRHSQQVVSRPQLFTSGSIPGEKWGYIDVRQGAHMFYWLYHTTHPDGYQARPWIIWLQGGPGLSSSAFGNFLMLGPLDQHGNKRNATWIQEASVLFIDNPVGSGFSYVDTPSLYVKSTEQISSDLVSFIKVFLAENPSFQTLPLHIMGQSYGGKMAPAFAHALNKAVQAGELLCNVAGTGIGNGWVSSIDFIENFGPLLYQMSRIDDKNYRLAQEKAAQLTAAYESGNRDHAYLDELYSAMYKFTFFGVGVYPYNVLEIRDHHTRGRRSSPLEETGFEHYPLSIYDHTQEMDVIMNGPVREKLGVIPPNIRWGATKPQVSSILWNSDVLFDVVDLVDDLLKNSSVRVAVYSGQLDVICNTLGAMKWVQRLTWPGLEGFNEADRKPLYTPGTQRVETFVRSHENLKFYWNLNAGHVVPEDVPDAALRMLRRILDDVDR